VVGSKAYTIIVDIARVSSARINKIRLTICPLGSRK
jgi:hypothetical protein